LTELPFRHVGRINGLFGVADYSPIHYSTTELTWSELCALYHIGKIYVTFTT